MVAIQSNPLKTLKHLPCIADVVRAPWRERLLAKIIQRKRARLNFHYVRAFKWSCDKVVDPIGAGAELDRPDREGRDALIAVEKVAGDVPVDVRPRPIGEPIQVGTIVVSQRREEGVVD